MKATTPDKRTLDGKSPELRFAFGKNWISFAQSALNTDRLAQARKDFHRLMADIPLHGKSFLDIGFGQGLVLCMAAEQGAQVHGLDIDDDNLPALQETAHHFNLQMVPETTIGSILDEDVVDHLLQKGGFDVVHSWGVLHHTGDMNQAITNAARLVKENGYLVIAIYNAHWSSWTWRQIKKLYNILPSLGQRIMIAVFYWVIYIAKFLVTGKNPKSKNRGMDFYHDVVDWVGGYPYEYASAHTIISFLSQKGFCIQTLNHCKVPTGCNELVLHKLSDINLGISNDAQ